VLFSLHYNFISIYVDKATTYAGSGFQKCYDLQFCVLIFNQFKKKFMTHRKRHLSQQKVELSTALKIVMAARLKNRLVKADRKLANILATEILQSLKQPEVLQVKKSLTHQVIA